MSEPNLPELPKAATPTPPTETQSVTRLALPAQEMPEAPPVTASEVIEATPPGARRWSRTQRIWMASGAALVIVIVIAAFAAGDSTAVPNATFADNSADGHWLDDQITAWKDADLAPGGFAEVDAKGLGAAECRGGAASAIEITLCRFVSAAAAADATVQAERMIGNNTGVVVTDGTRLLIVADRRSADPSGKVINRLVRTFVR